MKSDLMHLRSCWDDANSARNSYPFAEINDSDVYLWYGPNYTETSQKPSTDSDSYSKLQKAKYFEPRDEQKCDTARAVAYFYTRYPTEAGAITKTMYSVDTMIDWASNYECSSTQRAQYSRVVETQGNVNPYYEEEGLVKRAYCDESSAGCGDYE